MEDLGRGAVYDAIAELLAEKLATLGARALLGAADDFPGQSAPPPAAAVLGPSPRLLSPDTLLRLEAIERAAAAPPPAKSSAVLQLRKSSKTPYQIAFKDLPKHGTSRPDRRAQQKRGRRHGLQTMPDALKHAATMLTPVADRILRVFEQFKRAGLPWLEISARALGKVTGYELRSIWRGLKQIEACKLVTVIRRRDPLDPRNPEALRFNHVNRYVLCPRWAAYAGGVLRNRQANIEARRLENQERAAANQRARDLASQGAALEAETLRRQGVTFNAPNTGLSFTERAISLLDQGAAPPIFGLGTSLRSATAAFHPPP